MQTYMFSVIECSNKFLLYKVAKTKTDGMLERLVNDYTFEISFRVKHPTMLSNDICSLLNIDTDVKRNVGEPRITAKGKPLSGAWKETYCGFSVPRKANDSIPECLELMLIDLKNVKRGIKEIQKTGGSLEFYILASPKELTMGEKLTVSLMRDLVELGIDLSLEVYRSDNIEVPSVA